MWLGGECEEGTPESWDKCQFQSTETQSSTLAHHHAGRSARVPGQSPSWERREF